MKTDYDFSKGSERIKKTEASPIRIILDRAAKLRSEGHKVIPFSAGEPNFNTPESVKTATIQAIKDNYTHYCSNRGILELRRIISDEMKEKNHAQYDPKTEVLVTSSGAEALNNVILTFIENGDEVIIFTPAFVTYKNLVKYAGGKVVDIPVKAENNFIPDLEEVKAHITERTKMIIINNPNNPTGAVYPRRILEGLSEIAKNNNLLILSDEMYSSLVYEGAEFTSIASIGGMKERAIIVNGFSKTYAMTGWRIGYILSDRALINPVLRMHQYSTTCTPTFIQKGLVDSIELKDTKIAIESMHATFEKRRKRMLMALEGMGKLKIIKPNGAFYIMVDVSGLNMDGVECANHLLEEYDVATVPVIGMGGNSKYYIRISYAASDEDIEEGINRIQLFLKTLKG